MSDLNHITKTPRRAGRGEDENSGCDRHHSSTEKITPTPSINQVSARLWDNVPDELQQRAQWVTWKLIQREGAQKATKVPFNARTNKPASTTDPDTWSTFEVTMAAFYTGGYDGIGFVFTENDPYIGIDFDHVAWGANWDPEVLEHVKAISGYTETSPSGDGIHVIARAEVALNRNRITLENGSGFEAYTAGRYFTITGVTWNSVRPQTIPDSTLAVRSCLTRYLGEDAIASNETPHGKSELGGTGEHGVSFAPSPHPVEPDCFSATEESEEVIEKILLQARTARNGLKFKRLFDQGDLSDFHNDHSSADLALCGILAHWTRKDRALIDKIFRRSKLMRAKWDTPRGSTTYGQITITKAFEGGGYSAGRVTTSRTDGLEKVREYGASGRGSQECGRDEDQTSLKLTDLGNAERFARDHGQDVRFVHSWGAWLIWDGRRWKRDSTEKINRLAKLTIRRIYAEAAEATEESSRSSIASWAKRSEANERIKAMIKLAQSEPQIAITHDALDADPYLFNCSNGTICLRTGKLHEHRREDLLTKISPVEYVENCPCPMWLQFLDRIMGSDVDLIAFLKRFSGYSLTGDTSEQCLASLYGFGANGKSTFIDCLAMAWGDYFQRAPTSLILKRNDGSEGIPNDVARLPGVRMAVTSEVEEGSRMAESRIKDLTGGDRLAARFLRMEFFEFVPTHKLWIVGNHRIFISGTDHGIWRRIMQIPFEVTIPEADRDPKLKEKLIAQELSGILSWCVTGCIEWQRDGLNPPDKVTAATEEYRAEMDTVGQFVEERCLCNPSAQIGKDSLYQEYRLWAEMSGLHALSINRFGRRLKEKGFRDDRSGGQRVWIGIKLQPQSYY
jgi:putative DNA primase/helicase